MKIQVRVVRVVQVVSENEKKMNSQLRFIKSVIIFKVDK